MMSENKFNQSQDPKESLRIVPEELIKPEEPSMPEEAAKQENITYQEEEFVEPSFGDKVREFEKENNLLRTSVEQIARFFVDSCNNNLDTIKIDERIKELVMNVQSAVNAWLGGHAYEMAKPGEITAYLGVEVGKEIDKILGKEGGQGKAKAEKIKEKGYWGQFKEQAGL